MLAKAQAVARAVTDALGGWGLFGVELFVVGDDVLFSEVSPRPHDTGLVTLVSQDLSEFALHARAVLGLPVGEVLRLGAGEEQGAAASCAVLAEGHGVPEFTGVADGARRPHGAGPAVRQAGGARPAPGRGDARPRRRRGAGPGACRRGRRGPARRAGLTGSVTGGPRSAAPPGR